MANTAGRRVTNGAGHYKYPYLDVLRYQHQGEAIIQYDLSDKFSFRIDEDKARYSPTSRCLLNQTYMLLYTVDN